MSLYQRFVKCVFLPLGIVSCGILLLCTPVLSSPFEDKAQLRTRSHSNELANVKALKTVLDKNTFVLLPSASAIPNSISNRFTCEDRTLDTSPRPAFAEGQAPWQAGCIGSKLPRRKLIFAAKSGHYIVVAYMIANYSLRTCAKIFLLDSKENIETEWRLESINRPVKTVDDLRAAVRINNVQCRLTGW